MANQDTGVLSLSTSHWRFVLLSCVGALTMGLVFLFGGLSAQVAFLGTWISVLAGLVLSHIAVVQQKASSLSQFLAAASIPSKLAGQPMLLEQYTRLTNALAHLDEGRDPVLHEFTANKLASLANQAELLARGEIVFASTESWRTVYEQVLSDRRIGSYRSVSWFKSSEYWQDEPGRKSLALNLELAARGVRIERTVIVRDSLWARPEALPEPVVADWLKIQEQAGMRIRVLRESEIRSEPELCQDLGIYGDRAIGLQELDDRSRTLSFTLRFSPESISEALDRWERLQLFARRL